MTTMGEILDVDFRDRVVWRLAGGRVFHAAVGGSTGDGYAVVLVCRPSLVRWKSNEEIERLELRQDDDEEVTCKSCCRHLEGGG